jgi:hypothetical protein
MNSYPKISEGALVANRFKQRLAVLAVGLLASFGLIAGAGAANAATGDLVGSVTFSQDCSSGLGVGITYDGSSLWYSCAGSSTDLLRADPLTGNVTASYTIEGGLGALAYDATRNAIWAGPGLGSSGAIYLIQLDASHNVTSSAAAFTPAPGSFGGSGSLDDGLAYDGTNDSLYYSPDGSTTISHYTTTGALLADNGANWAGITAGSACYNSGLGLGGSDLYQGSDGCSHVYVATKTDPSTSTFDFSTQVAGDPNFRDEGLTCDPNTFAASQGKQVMWSKEAYSPMRAHAFEIPSGSCGFGGLPTVDSPITASGLTFSPTEGKAYSGQVASFTDPDTASTAGEYSATIDWGDGSSTSGTVSGSSGSFTVNGTHTYADEGTNKVSVTIKDTDNTANTATASSTANVVDAALSASGVNPTSPQGFNGVVANFTDANTATSSSADFTATIDWGDGSSTSTGTVSGSGGSYTVNGTHTYAGTGYFTVKVHIVDDGGSTADASSTVLIFGTPSGGNFVIGDKNAAVGTSVTFWGAQWSKHNTLSGGSAPASFKGFEDSPAAPGCAVSWTTDPGNSTPPPAGPLPAYMAVIVSRSITQSGPSIGGNNVHIVVVRTDSGYAPNPGNAGTGTVVGGVC